MARLSALKAALHEAGCDPDAVIADLVHRFPRTPTTPPVEPAPAEPTWDELHARYNAPAVEAEPSNPEPPEAA